MRTSHPVLSDFIFACRVLYSFQIGTLVRSAREQQIPQRVRNARGHVYIAHSVQRLLFEFWLYLFQEKSKTTKQEMTAWASQHAALVVTFRQDHQVLASNAQARGLSINILEGAELLLIKHVI